MCCICFHDISGKIRAVPGGLKAMIFLSRHRRIVNWNLGVSKAFTHDDVDTFCVFANAISL